MARYVFDEFELDESTSELRRAGEPVALQPKVFELLLALVRAPDRLLTRQALFEEMWPGIAISEAALYRLVKEARAALGDDGRSQRLLRTQARRGIRFVAPVEVIDDTPEALRARVDSLCATARQALRDEQFARAAGLLEEALSCLPADSDPAERAALDVELAGAWAAALEPLRARRVALAGVEAAREASDPAWLARAVLAIPELLVHGRVDREFLRLAEEALEAPAEDVEEVLRGRLFNRLAYHLYWSRELHRSASCNRTAREIAGACDDAHLLSWVCLIDHMLEPATDGSRRRLELAHDALHAAQRAGDPSLEVYAREQIAHDAMGDGDLETVQEQASAIEAVAERAAVAWPQRVRVMLALHHGDFQAADRMLASALEGESVALRIQYRAPQLLWLRLQQGRIGELLELVRGFVANASDIPVWRGALALSEWHAGNVDAARAEYEGLAAFDLQDLPDDFTTPTALTHLAELCANLDDAPRAKVLYPKLKPLSGRLVVMPRAALVLGPADFFLGRLAAAAGQLEAAEAHLGAAVALAERLRARPALARAHAALADLLADRGDAADRVACREHASQAHTLARTLGMAPLVRELEAHLDARG